MDNEISIHLKTAFDDTKFQLVSHKSYQQNLADAMQTFENHFQTGLASADPKFPISEWD